MQYVEHLGLDAALGFAPGAIGPETPAPKLGQYGLRKYGPSGICPAKEQDIMQSLSHQNLRSQRPQCRSAGRTPRVRPGCRRLLGHPPNSSTCAEGLIESVASGSDGTY